MMISEKKIATILRQHGYKLTPQRRGVIRTIASTQGHLTPAAIYKKHPLLSTFFLGFIVREKAML